MHTLMCRHNTLILLMLSVEDHANDELNLELPDPGLEPGILQTEICELVQSRLRVEELMKAAGHRHIDTHTHTHTLIFMSCTIKTFNHLY